MIERLARRRLRRALAAVTLCALAWRAGAQSDSIPHAGAGAAGRATLLVLRTSEPLRLDPRLDDPVWERADSIVDFRQREPAEGAAATERTVVKVVRDADALYVAVRAYDRSPAEIRAAQLRRDADLSSDDNVTLLIDSFHDRRSAFVFQTNPNGAMWDAQFSGVDLLNEDWNGLWEVATARDSAGWTAEFRIPFRTLRFGTGAGATFGFNVRRLVRRKNEETLWRSWGRAQGLYLLTAEGELTGLGALSRAHGPELEPYVLARAVEAEHDPSGAPTTGGYVGAKGGLDAKLAVTPTLTGDVTVNTDFAQVEADRQVINLTRFPLFFPEKREFFLESSGIFSFGTEQRAQLFYSRRIGLDSLGTPVPILGGARITGRTGAWTIGVLDARTGGRDAANDAVVRLTRDLLARSYIGAMAVQRSGPGVRDREQGAGIDVDLPLVAGGHNVEPKLWIAGTRTPGAAGTPIAWRLSTDYPNDLFDNFASLYRIDSGFAPSLGFVRRTGVWETTGHVDYMPRPGILGIRRLDFEAPIPTWDIIADESASPRSLGDGRTWQTATLDWILLGGALESGDEFAAHVLRLMDAPTTSFAVFRGVVVAPGRYWWTRQQLEYQTSAGRPASVGAVVDWGGFYDGRSTEASVTATWRGGGHVILGGDVTRTEAALAAGRFVATQTAGRVEYAFSTRRDVLAFVQFNNEDRRTDFDFRYHWIPKLGDDLYVVWNSGYTTDPAARFRFPSRAALGRPLNGALVVKLRHRL